MRTFVIADSFKRKVRPIGVLTCADDGSMHIRISSKAQEKDVPLSLLGALSRETRELSPEETLYWARTRIAPPTRQNIGRVLEANGLAEYRESQLLMSTQGFSTDDDFMVFEVTGLLDSIIKAFDEAEALDKASTAKPRKNKRPAKRTRPVENLDPIADCDAFIDALGTSWRSQRSSGVQIEYSIIDTKEGGTSAVEVGKMVRELRKSRGFTQQELCAKAGIKQSVLSNLESGHGNPTLGLLRSVTSAMNARVSVTITPNK